MKREEIAENIKREFKENSNTLSILGDDVRQQILLILMENCKKKGTQAPEIASRINLSRPAVSHHLKILKDGEIISVRKEGTKNYYYISGCDKILKLKSLLDNIDYLVNKGDEYDEN